jgi:mannitol-1-phosphate/altronate dehydrogenase
MDYVTIEWSSTVIPCSNIQNANNGYLDSDGLYMVLTGKPDNSGHKYVDISLQYIGQAYDQTIRERVQQEHDAYTQIKKFLSTNKGYKVLIRPGIITDISQKRKSKELVDDVEACLIFYNQPITNTVHKDSYSGRDITITNCGKYFPLEEVSVRQSEKK